MIGPCIVVVHADEIDLIEPHVERQLQANISDCSADPDQARGIGREARKTRMRVEIVYGAQVVMIAAVELGVLEMNREKASRLLDVLLEIGRASCRERVGQYV